MLFYDYRPFMKLLETILKKLIPLLIFSFFISFVTAQELTQEEVKLYNKIMEYRKVNNLPTIPLSRSLTFVAKTHVKDLADHSPDRGNKCNMHSWSNNGDWVDCCYTSDHTQAKCMWDKPRELTSYQGNGYEISHGSPGYSEHVVTAESALNGWKNSPGHNNVIINQGIWTSRWKAIGIGIYKNYAVVWFGKETDQN